MVVYSDGVGDSVHAQIMHAGAQGMTSLGSDLNLSGPTSGNSYYPDVAALENGGFAAVWTSGSAVMARAFDGSGVPLTNIISTGINSLYGYQHVATLPGGSFVVSAVDQSDQNVHSKEYDNAGSLIISADASVPNGTGWGVDTAGLVNGGYVLVATTYTGNHDVAGVVNYDSPRNYTGTTGNDALFGGKLNDRLDGGGGNDVLTGGGGKDTFVTRASDPGQVTITDFTLGDKIDVTDLAFGGNTTVGYSGDITHGTLAVSDGTHTANIALLGNYMASHFVTTTDGHGGTFITDPPAQDPSQLTPPQG